MPLADVLTADWLQDRYLVGIDLTDDDGAAYPSAIYSQSIRNAISTIAQHLDIELDGIRHQSEERHDRLDMDEEGFHFRRTRKRPLRGVTQLEWKYGNFAGTALPTSWHETVSPLMGDCRIVPSSDSLNAATVSSLSFFYNNSLHHLTPGWWRLDYRYGYDDRRRGVALGTFTERFYVHGPLRITPSVAPAADETYTATVTGRTFDADEGRGIGASTTEALTWTAADGAYEQFTSATITQVTSITLATDGDSTPTFDIEGPLPWPEAIEDAVGLTAAMLLLDTAGDLIVGAGIASESVSLDGLSTNINTTSSATNAGYGARILSYQKRLKAILADLSAQLDRREVFAV